MIRELVERSVEFANDPNDATDEELAEVFAPDVVLDYSVRVFNPRVYEGYAGLREFRADVNEVWESMTGSDVEIIEKGDHALILARVEARARASGVTIVVESAGIWTVRDGRLARYRHLSVDSANRDEALTALHDISG